MVDKTCQYKMYCYDCGLFLQSAVTGFCGHTRCDLCCGRKKICSCGEEFGVREKDFLIISMLDDINLVEKQFWMLLNIQGRDGENTDGETEAVAMSTEDEDYHLVEMNPVEIVFYNKFCTFTREVSISKYLAWLLRNPEQTTLVLYRLYKHRIRLWLNAGLLNCPVCSDVMNRPVTTACGHTFCRDCLERVMDYSVVCPFCKVQMEDLNIDILKDNEVVSMAIKFSGAAVRPDPEPYPENTVMACFSPEPIFPAMPGYYSATKGDQQFKFRQCYKSAQKMFAIYNLQLSESFGTLMLITDVVRLPDNKMLITACGIQRIQIEELHAEDGMGKLTYKLYVDIHVEPSDPTLKLAEAHAHAWFRSLEPQDQATALSMYGPMKSDGVEVDGPHWLWWMAKVLPMCLSLRGTFLTLDMLQRCNVIMTTVKAWRNFPEPRNFSEVKNRRIFLCLKRQTIINMPNFIDMPNDMDMSSLIDLQAVM